MIQKENPKILKCLVLGDGTVGKTSLIIKHSSGTFPENYVRVASDVAFFPTPYTIDDTTFELSIWDTGSGGGEDYDRLRPLSYPLTDVFILCFSVVDPGSLERVRTKYAPDIAHHNPETPFMVVGTKVDLRDDFSEISGEMTTRQIYHHEALSLSEMIGATSYMECSALTGFGVSDVFEQAARVALNNLRSGKGKQQKYGKNRCVVI